MPQRAELARELRGARALTDRLFELVRPEFFYDRPIPERHRIIFYLGHLEAFDWNLVCRRALDMPSFHESFDRLFAFGIDPEEGQLPSDQPGDWPSVAEIADYNRRIRTTLDRIWDEAPPQILEAVIEHRLMHVETFAYILHNMPLDEKTAIPASRPETAPPPKAEMIAIPAGEAILGTAKDNGFGWDNEFEAHRVHVPAFEISRYKVTNGEYLEFVRAGARAPYFWVERNGQWFHREMFSEVRLPLDWPVYLTHEEATAYARWVGKALPSEPQWHRAALGSARGLDRSFPWGDALPDAKRGNFDCQRWDPVAVTATPGGDSEFGVSQMAGNGWEWTATLFEPFPGFQTFSFYPGYSAPFFDGAHYVLKGGSALTCARLLRRSFRNWFRPRYPYVYAGFRLVEQ